MQQGKLDEALTIYQKELQANPNSVDAASGMGNVLDLLGKTSEARSSRSISDRLRVFHTGDFKKALADLTQADPADPFIQYLIGMAHEKLGDRQKAMEAYKSH
jgi:tetratricopeptide (TPR) repeat protein